jgi:ABC-2 type transport system ATP-binding protein
LQGVDIEVPQGSVFALLGENGAGKTTLIRALTGFLKPTAGSCSVLGMDPVRQAVEIRRRVGYVSDSPAMYDWMKVGQIGWFAAAFYPDGFTDRFQETVEQYEVPLDRKIRHLSKGQRAKVALALALAHDPELLILDEPTSGVDPLVRREFLESMLDRVATGRTVLLSSHQISEVERVADHVAILHQGRLSINEPLSQLRESVSEVIVSLNDPLVEVPALAAPAIVLSESTEGRQRRMLVRNLSDEMVSMLKNRSGVGSVQVRPSTLDDLFAACIRHEAVLAPA